MDKFWKDNEPVEIRCDGCHKYVVPIEIKGEFTNRKECPNCHYTIGITFKPRKLKKREW